MPQFIGRKNLQYKLGDYERMAKAQQRATNVLARRAQGVAGAGVTAAIAAASGGGRPQFESGTLGQRKRQNTGTKC